MDNGSKKVHQSMDTNWNTKSAEIRVKPKRIQAHIEAVVWDCKTNWSFLLSLLLLLKCNICGLYITNVQVHTVSRRLPPRHPVCPSFSALGSVYVTCTRQTCWRNLKRTFLCTCTITQTHKGISFKNQAQQYNLKSIKHKQNCTQTHTSRRVTQSLRHIRPSVFLCPVSFCQAWDEILTRRTAP